MKALDTCYLIWLFENHKESILLKSDYVITSFNYQELLHVEHRHKISSHVRNHIRSFEKKHGFNIVEIPVSPGNNLEEVSYVHEIDPGLLNHVKDPSDAVLVAFCIKNKFDLVTRDRHDIYKAVNENYFSKNNLQLLKSLRD